MSFWKEIEEMSKNRGKSKENGHFWKAGDPRQSNSVNQIARFGQLDLPKAQRHRTSNWESDRNFSFSAL